MMNQDDVPNIARLATRLAENNGRVTHCLDQISNRVDALVTALRQADWNEIQRLSKDLSAGNSQNLDTIQYRAERVCEELKKPNNLHAIKQSVVRLIGACGTTIYDKNAEKRVDWNI